MGKAGCQGVAQEVAFVETEQEREAEDREIEELENLEVEGQETKELGD